MQSVSTWRIARRAAAVKTGHASRAWRRWLFAALALLAFIAPLGGLRGLWEPDEGRYSSVALRMLDRGDFWVPYIDAEHPHLTKPPMTYWALAASFTIFGKNEWAARAPNAIAFTVTGLLVAWLASLLGLRRPFVAMAIWATMLMPFIAANAVTADTLLAMFETLAVAGYAWSLTGPRGARAGIWLTWIALGAGFLTKGTPALIALLPIVAVAGVRGRQAVRAVFSPLPVIVFVGIALGWFLFLVGRNPELSRYFLVDEVAARVGTGLHHRNPGWQGLVSVYLPTLLLGALPWLPIIAWLRLRRAPAALAGAWSTRELTLLLGTWLVPPFVVFALSQSRLPLYLLPLFVPIALAFAAQLPENMSRRAEVAGRALLGVWVAALLALQAGAAAVETRLDSRRLASELRAVVDVARVDELVFVDRQAAYGLRLYLPIEIEEASIYPADSMHGLPGRHGVCDEIRERRSPLLLVRPGALARVQAIARSCGADLIGLGPLWNGELLGPAVAARTWRIRTPAAAGD